MFSSVAYASTAPAAGGMESMLMQFMPLILMFAVFYFLLIRPQQKKAKEHKALLAALKKDDQILTSSGILGRITNIEGEIITIDLGNSEIKIMRPYIATVVDHTKLAEQSAEKPAEKK